MANRNNRRNNQNQANQQSTLRKSDNPLQGIPIKDPGCIEMLKKLIEKRKEGFSNDQVSMYIGNLMTAYPVEVTNLKAVEKKITGIQKAAPEKDSEDEFIIDDCNGCLGTQREKTIRDLRSCRSPQQIEEFFITIQYETDRKMLAVIKHLMNSLGYEMKSKTRDKALKEFYDSLQGGDRRKNKIENVYGVKKARSKMIA